MKEKQIKNPGPDHPISIQHNRARVVVSVARRVIADTRNALTLREADYPPVQYIPREHVDFSQLERTDHAPSGPYKGTAITTAFPLEEGSPSMPCGRMRIHFPQFRRSKDMSRSTPTVSMR